MAEIVLMRNFDRGNSHTLDGYRGAGGYGAWETAKGMEPDAITDAVKKSNLRGLGGAGFPNGMKW
jgi:NADH-quinone oxidoreductase subunit F